MCPQHNDEQNGRHGDERAQRVERQRRSYCIEAEADVAGVPDYALRPAVDNRVTALGLNSNHR
jgi:hypothetical protein